MQDSKKVLSNNELVRIVRPQISTNKKKEKYTTNLGLFEVPRDKFKPQHNEMMLSL